MTESPIQFHQTAAKTERAFLVGTYEPQEELSDVREHLAELRELVKSLGVEPCGEILALVRTHNPRLFVGSGKAAEIRDAALEADASVIVFDSALGPSQQRNLERLCQIKVIDRQEVILDIFAKRAWTREAVLQVELARFRYFLPRLTGAWSHLSRQRGGGTGARGDGEKQIEYDRRQLKTRIAELEEELSIVRKQRAVQRKSRLRGNYPTGAIVGYTNAGKSTLLNTLTGSDVLAADKLFATLDPTTRKLILNDRREVLLTDTVGFVRKLPHSLVEAFKSTLEEAELADFILLILDASSRQVRDHWETTLAVLAEIGAENKPLLVVFNKADLQEDPVERLKLRNAAPDAIFTSCSSGEGIARLKDAIARKISVRSGVLHLAIPPARSELVALLYRKGAILDSSYDENGAFRAAAILQDAAVELFSDFIIQNPHEVSVLRDRSADTPRSLPI